ncbi:MAG: ferritin-like domain-containing protein [Acidimicrobiales bacterium]
MSIDDRALGALLEESEDLHADAMRHTTVAMADVVERGREMRARGGPDRDETRRFHVDRAKLLTAAGLGTVAVLGARAAAADTPADVAAAQTAASIENLAVKVYGTAAGLPFMKDIAAPAGPTVTAFVTRTVQQHTEHAAAFNAAAQKLGGKPQTGPDTVVYNSVVVPALPKLKTPKDVVDFAAQLELVAAETYAAQTAAVADSNLRSTFASIMGVENQHRAILLAVSALLGANAPQLIKIGGVVGQLPAAAGSVGFPDAFLPLTDARPATEGAVK